MSIYQATTFLDHERQIALSASYRAYEDNTPLPTLQIYLTFPGPFLGLHENFQEANFWCREIARVLDEEGLFNKEGLHGIRFEVYETRKPTRDMPSDELIKMYQDHAIAIRETRHLITSLFRDRAVVLATVQELRSQGITDDEIKLRPAIQRSCELALQYKDLLLEANKVRWAQSAFPQSKRENRSIEAPVGTFYNPREDMVTIFTPDSHRTANQPYHNVIMLIENNHKALHNLTVVMFNKHHDWGANASTIDDLPEEMKIDVSLRSGRVAVIDGEKWIVPGLADVLKECFNSSGQAEMMVQQMREFAKAT